MSSFEIKSYSIEEKISDLKDDQAVIVSDGSFDETNKRYGYGVIFVRNEKDEVELSGSENDSKFVESRNIPGEVEGILKGLEKCKDENYKEVFIFYDYTGLAEWANGSWKTNKPISKYYVEKLENYRDIKIHFCKVKAHSGVKYNERADKLAKASLKGY